MAEPKELLALLKLWNLWELLPHLSEEGVGIEELLLMKHHHIVELLQHQKLGTRIRFEHHFERWRRDMHKPLVSTQRQSSTILLPQQMKLANNTAKRINTQSRATNTESPLRHHVGTNTSPDLTPAATTRTTTATLPTFIPANITPVPMAAVTTLSTAPTVPPMVPGAPTPKDAAATTLHRDGLRKLMPKLTPQPALLVDTNASAIAGTPTGTGSSVGVNAMATPASPVLPLSPTQLLSYSLDAPLRYAEPQQQQQQQQHQQPQPYSSSSSVTHSNKNNEIISLSLLQILSSSGTKGQTLMEYYQQFKELRNNHRSLLIQLIVNYFDMHDYHLSLNVSHNLEQQILRLFPTEKLENYRTEKRGKIYVKFCNMKRYKRDRTMLKRKFETDVQITNEAMLKDVETMDVNVDIEDFVGLNYDDEWPNQQAQTEMIVKTETLSDDDA